MSWAEVPEPPSPADGRARWWVGELAVAAGGAAPLVGGRAPTPAAVLALVVAAASVVVGRRAAADGSSGLEAGRRPLLGCSLGAVVVELVGGPWPVPVGLVVVGHAALWWSDRRPAAATRVADWTDRWARRVADAVSAVALALVWLPLVGLPWLLHRVVRVDPTWQPRRAGSRWVAASPDPVDDRMWRRGTTSTRPPRQRLARLVGVVAVLATVVLVGGQIARRADVAARRAVADSPALGGAEWWPRVDSAMQVTYLRARLSSYLGLELPDVDVDGLSVRAGRRGGWTPPERPGCPTTEVWLYGGSAAFGIGQRDEWTIGSWLARLAWADGVRLDVANLGVPGDTAWMEARRLEVASAGSSPPPDLVVFYDGANDLITRVDLAARADGRWPVLANYLDTGVLPGVEWARGLLASLTELSDPVPVRTGSSGPAPDDAEVVRSAVEQYRLGRVAAARLLEEQGVAGIWALQPVLAGRPEAVDGEPAHDPAGPEAGRWRAFRDAVGPEVVDLSGVFDGVEEPVYFDPVHHNEAGARAVAAALWPAVRDRLALEGAGACR